MYTVFITLFLTWLIWYLRERYLWYQNVISQNPKRASLNPVQTNSMEMNDKLAEPKYSSPKCLAPYCTFKQISRLSSSKLNEMQKRKRFANMVLEISLVLSFSEVQDIGVYIFQYKNFRIPGKVKNGNDYCHVDCCTIKIVKHEGTTILKRLIINKEKVTSLDEMFAILHLIFCVHTHTITHIAAGNIAEINVNQIQNGGDLSEDFKKTIDDMHAAVSGMNESANHYAADI